MGAKQKAEGIGLTDGPELKPCPFCGGEASFKPRSFKASCDKCGAHVPVGATDSAEAIAAWNTRADLHAAAVAELVEGLRACRSDIGKATSTDKAVPWEVLDALATCDALIAKYEVTK